MKDTNGNISCVLSVGPVGGASSHPIDFIRGKVPGSPDWPANEEIKTYEWSMTKDQYQKCKKRCEEMRKSPGPYTFDSQCTTNSLKLARDCNIKVPSGAGPVSAHKNLGKFLGHAEVTKTVENPYQLAHELSQMKKPSATYEEGTMPHGLPTTVPQPNTNNGNK